MSAPACDPARKAGSAQPIRRALVLLALAASLLALSSPGSASAQPRREGA